MAGVSPSASSPLERFVAPLERLGERTNPLTVRVVRQHLRSMAFIGLFCLLLAFAVLACLLALMGNSGGQAGTGRWLFIILAGAWSLVAWVFQPSAACQAVAAERRDQVWELIDLTGMSPRRVLLGFLGATVIQQALVAAAVAPFMVMAWLLRGLDLWFVVLTLLTIPLGGVVGTALAMQAACAVKPGRQRSSGVALSLACFLLWCLGVSAGVSLMRFHGDDALMSALHAGQPGAWMGLAFVLNLAALITATALVSGATKLAHPASNRSTAMRLLAFVFWLNALLWCLGMMKLGWTLGWALAIFAVAGVTRATVMGLAAVSENYDLTPRQARDIANAPLRWRWTMAVLGPGASRGRAAFLVMVAISVLLGLLGMKLGGNRESFRATLSAWGIACYAALFMCVGDVLTRRVLCRRIHRPAVQQAVTWALAIACTIGSYLAAALSNGFGVVGTLINPLLGVAAFIREDDLPYGHIVVVVMSTLGGISLVVLLLQALRHRGAARRLQPEDA